MKQNTDGYYTNRHSCFLLQYHLVLVTKYRKPVIAGQLESDLKHYITQYFKDRDIVIQALETMPDHIHILFDAPPQISLSEFVNALKSASSRRMQTNHREYLKQWYWKPYFWNLSYFIGTVSDRTAEAVKQYINNQK